MIFNFLNQQKDKACTEKTINIMNLSVKLQRKVEREERWDKGRGGRVIHDILQSNEHGVQHPYNSTLSSSSSTSISFQVIPPAQHMQS